MNFRKPQIVTVDLNQLSSMIADSFERGFNLSAARSGKASREAYGMGLAAGRAEAYTECQRDCESTGLQDIESRLLALEEQMQKTLSFPAQTPEGETSETG